MDLKAELIVAIDSCDYLFVRELGEPEENSLRLVLEEAKASFEATSVQIAGTTISDCHRIKSTSNSRLFEITWHTYVAYSVKNESYARTDAYETSEGESLRLFSKSHFLDYVSRTTFATEEYPGPMQHIRVNSENHVVDVISTADPEIRQLRPVSISGWMH